MDSSGPAYPNHGFCTLTYMYLDRGTCSWPRLADRRCL